MAVVDFAIALTARLLREPRRSRRRLEREMRVLLRYWHLGPALCAFRRLSGHARAARARALGEAFEVLRSVTELARFARASRRVGASAVVKRAVRTWQAITSRQERVRSALACHEYALGGREGPRRALLRLRAFASRVAASRRMVSQARWWKLRLAFIHLQERCRAVPSVRALRALCASRWLSLCLLVLVTIALQAEASRRVQAMTGRARSLRLRFMFTRMQQRAAGAAAAGTAAAVARAAAIKRSVVRWRAHAVVDAAIAGVAALGTHTGNAFALGFAMRYWRRAASWRSLLVADIAAHWEKQKRKLVASKLEFWRAEARGGVREGRDGCCMSSSLAEASHFQAVGCAAETICTSAWSLQLMWRHWRQEAAWAVAHANALCVWSVRRRWVVSMPSSGSVEEAGRAIAASARCALALRHWRRLRRRAPQPLRWRPTMITLALWKARAVERRCEVARWSLSGAVLARRRTAHSLWGWRAWAHRNSTRALTREIRHLRAAADGRLLLDPRLDGQTIPLGFDGARGAMLTLRVVNRRLCRLVWRAWHAAAARLSDERRIDAVVAQWDAYRLWRRRAHTLSLSRELQKLAASHLSRQMFRNWTRNYNRKATDQTRDMSRDRAARLRINLQRWRKAARVRLHVASALLLALRVIERRWQVTAFCRWQQSAAAEGTCAVVAGAARRKIVARALERIRQGTRAAASASAAGRVRRETAESADAARHMKLKAGALASWSRFAAMQRKLGSRLFTLRHKTVGLQLLHQALLRWECARCSRRHVTSSLALAAQARQRVILSDLRRSCALLVACRFRAARAANSCTMRNLRWGFAVLAAQAMDSNALRSRSLLATARWRRHCLGGAMRTLLRNAVSRLMDFRQLDVPANAHAQVRAYIGAFHGLRRRQNVAHQQADHARTIHTNALAIAVRAWASAHRWQAHAFSAVVVAGQRWRDTALRYAMNMLRVAGRRSVAQLQPSRRLRRLAVAAARAELIRQTAGARVHAEANGPNLEELLDVDASEEGDLADGRKRERNGSFSLVLEVAAPVDPPAAAANSLKKLGDNIDLGCSASQHLNAHSCTSSACAPIAQALNPAIRPANGSPPPLPPPERCLSPQHASPRSERPSISGVGNGVDFPRFSLSLLKKKLSRSAEGSKRALAHRHSAPSETGGRSRLESHSSPWFGAPRRSTPAYQAVVYTSLDCGSPMATSPIIFPPGPAAAAQIPASSLPLSAPLSSNGEEWPSSMSSSIASSITPSNTLSADSPCAPPAAGRKAPPLNEKICSLAQASATWIPTAQCVESVAYPAGTFHLQPSEQRSREQGCVQLPGDNLERVLTSSQSPERLLLEHTKCQLLSLDEAYQSWQPPSIASGASYDLEKQGRSMGGSPMPVGACADSTIDSPGNESDQTTPALDAQFAQWASTRASRSQETPSAPISSFEGSSHLLESETELFKSSDAPHGYHIDGHRSSARRVLQWS